MANELQTISWIVGGAVVIGLGYFAYTKGLFDQAFTFVNDAIKNSGSSTAPKEEEKEEEEKPKEEKKKSKLALSYLGGSTTPYASHRFYAVVG